MSEYIKKIRMYDKIVKPCRITGYCPYGTLVEEFPLEKDEYTCSVFGHHCPAYYQAEPFVDEKDSELSDEEIDTMWNEMERLWVEKTEE